MVIRSENGKVCVTECFKALFCGLQFDVENAYFDNVSRQGSTSLKDML